MVFQSLHVPYFLALEYGKYMSRKGPESCLGMLDFVEDWKLDVVLH